MVNLSLIRKILPSCCEADALDITALTDDERKQLSGFLPNFKTVIVLAHHVKHSLEWTWFSFDSSRIGSVPPADLHLEAESLKISDYLHKEGYNSLLIPYPGISGIRFKDLADKTGLGKIGDNFLFLHREWGPWTHLRILLTDAEIKGRLDPCDAVCIHCGRCVAACPANAIQKEELLGIECGAYQHRISESTAYDYQCENCIRACPIGTAPRPVQII